MHMTSVKIAMYVLEMHCAPLNFQFSLNLVDCFPGAYIIVTIVMKGIYVLHFLLPSYNKVTLS